MNVTFDEGESETLYTISINNSSPAVVNGVDPDGPGTFESAVFADSEIHGNSIQLVRNNNDSLVLGTNSFFNITSSSSLGWASTATVPFGINLGHNEIWNGSLVLGGSYDANRITSGSWALIPESSQNGTFITTGQQNLTNATLELPNTAEQDLQVYPAVIDFNNEAIILPKDINYCASDFVVKLNILLQNAAAETTPGTLEVLIPGNIKSSPGRCKSSSSASVLVLGKPFFQAAYIMVPNPSGQVWLINAHQCDLPPQPEPFSTQAALTAASAPTSATPTASPTSKHSSGHKLKPGTMFGGSITSFMSLLGTTLIACFCNKAL